MNGNVNNLNEIGTRKSSCVNARGIPTAAYQVVLSRGGGVGTLDQGGRYLGWGVGTLDRGVSTWDGGGRYLGQDVGTSDRGGRYLGWGVGTLDRG